jgi:hypothetical protein
VIILTPTTEIDTLLARLAAQQQRIVGILTDLDEDAMRRVLLPSGWSCAGMVQHLTLTTRFWCAEVICGQPARPRPGDDFDVSAGESSTSLVAAYEEAARTGADLVRHLPPSTRPAWWPEGRWGPWRLNDLSEVLLHLLVETSTHAGHLDIVRELIDGRTWEYPEGRLSKP